MLGRVVLKVEAETMVVIEIYMVVMEVHMIAEMVMVLEGVEVDLVLK